MKIVTHKKQRVSLWTKVRWRDFVTMKLFIEVFNNIVYLSLLSP